MSTLVREPGIHYGRFRVLRRTDGSLFVYDPAQPVGRRAVAEVTGSDAGVVCKRLSEEASARGETNEPARQGYKLDWGDPKTWEDTARVPSRPLFPSLHEKDEAYGEEEERGPRSGPRRSAGVGPGAAAAASGRGRP